MGDTDEHKKYKELFRGVFGDADVKRVIESFAPVESPVPERIGLSLNVNWTSELADRLRTKTRSINLALDRSDPVTDQDLRFIRDHAANVPDWHIDFLSRNNWDQASF